MEKREYVKIDWSKKCEYRVPVRLQGKTLSCTAVATTGLVEYWMDSENLGEFSLQHLLDLAPIQNEKDLQFSLTELLDYVKKEGICLKSEHRPLDWQRKPTTVCNGKRHKLEFEKVTNDENVMMKTLMQRGPFIARIHATKQLWKWRGKHTKDQIFVQKEKWISTKKGKETKKHAILVVGYGCKLVKRKEWVSYFIIQNSWGKDWADGGYAKVCMGSCTKFGFCPLKALYIPSSKNKCGMKYIPKSVSIPKSNEPDLGSMGYPYTSVNEVEERKYEEVCPPQVEDFCYITDITYCKDENSKLGYYMLYRPSHMSDCVKELQLDGSTACCISTGGSFRRQASSTSDVTLPSTLQAMKKGIHTFLEMERGDDKLMDPQFCAKIACDIYGNFRMAEVSKRPPMGFMEQIQRDVIACEIYNLCMAEVAEEYRLVPESYKFCHFSSRASSVPSPWTTQVDFHVTASSPSETISVCDSLGSPRFEYIDDREADGCLSPGGIHTWSSFYKTERGDKKLMDPQFCTAIACEIYNLCMAEVVEEYRLVPETHLLAVNYIDHYLSGNAINRPRIQLVGVRRMMLAATFEKGPSATIQQRGDDKFMDPGFCAKIACDIYGNFLMAEVSKRPPMGFMEQQQIQRDVIACEIYNLCMAEVAEEYRLVPETHLLAVNYIDHYLSGNAINRKYEQVCPHKVENFCYITDNTYCKDKVLQMESAALDYLKFEMTSPPTYHFLRWFVLDGQDYNEAPSIQLEFMSSYVLELSLGECSMLCYTPSIIAASNLCLAKYILSPSKKPWNSKLGYYMLYRPSHMSDCVKELQLDGSTACCISTGGSFRRQASSTSDVTLPSTLQAMKSCRGMEESS